jgi:hypothetical protein
MRSFLGSHREPSSGGTRSGSGSRFAGGLRGVGGHGFGLEGRRSSERSSVGSIRASRSRLGGLSGPLGLRARAPRVDGRRGGRAPSREVRWIFGSIGSAGSGRGRRGVRDSWMEGPTTSRVARLRGRDARGRGVTSRALGLEAFEVPGGRGPCSLGSGVTGGSEAGSSKVLRSRSLSRATCHAFFGIRIR